MLDSVVREDPSEEITFPIPEVLFRQRPAGAKTLRVEHA